MENRQDIIAEVATALLTEAEKFEKRRIQVTSPVEIVKEILKGVRDPQPPEDNRPGVVRIPSPPPDFPKLLVDYAKQEFAVVENWADWAPIHHFWVRPMSELTTLKETGFKERPKQDWERRKKANA
jgi:hypothetical protein